VAFELIASAFSMTQARGMAIVMVETGDEPGHAASRATIALVVKSDSHWEWRALYFSIS